MSNHAGDPLWMAFIQDRLDRLEAVKQNAEHYRAMLRSDIRMGAFPPIGWRTVAQRESAAKTPPNGQPT